MAANQTIANSVWPHNRGSAVTYVPSSVGWGAKFSGATGSTNLLSYEMVIPGRFSFEVFFRTGASVTSRSLVGFNAAYAGNSATQALGIYFDGSSHLNLHTYETGVTDHFATDSTTTYAANTVYHVVGTGDGTNIRLYLNGVQVASATATVEDTSDFSPPVLCVGACNQGASGAGTNMAADCTMLLVNLAEKCWTPGEVLARAFDPFGFLQFENDQLFSLLKGTATTTFTSTTDQTLLKISEVLAASQSPGFTVDQTLKLISQVLAATNTPPLTVDQTLKLVSQIVNMKATIGPTNPQFFSWFTE